MKPILLILFIFLPVTVFCGRYDTIEELYNPENRKCYTNVEFSSYYSGSKVTFYHDKGLASIDIEYLPDDIIEKWELPSKKKIKEIKQNISNIQQKKEKQKKNEVPYFSNYEKIKFKDIGRFDNREFKLTDGKRTIKTVNTIEFLHRINRNEMLVRRGYYLPESKDYHPFAKHCRYLCISNYDNNGILSGEEIQLNGIFEASGTKTVRIKGKYKTILVLEKIGD